MMPIYGFFQVSPKIKQKPSIQPPSQISYICCFLPRTKSAQKLNKNPVSNRLVKYPTSAVLNAI